MPTITLGLDLGDRSSRYAVLDAEAHVVGEGSVATTREAMRRFLRRAPSGAGDSRSRDPLAVGEPPHRELWA